MIRFPSTDRKNVPKQKMKLALKGLTGDEVIKYARALLFFCAFLATLVALPRYVGNGYIYLAFSLLANTLLYFGFRKNAIFFDAFIGVFFWIGFWLKLTVRILFFDGHFSEAVGDFDYTSGGYDRALLVSACGILGLLLASVVREYFIFKYGRRELSKNDYLTSGFFDKHRTPILTGFFLLFFSVAILNVIFGIYQKGAITQTVLPYGLNGVFKWLILFGLASFSALVLRYELVMRKELSIGVVLLVLLESFSTNTSLLSRGMVLNVGALAYGVYVSCKLDLIKLNFRTLAVSFILFCGLFFGSVVAVNDLRGSGPGYLREGASMGGGDAVVVVGHVTPLFLNRWVGIEGVMAVSSSSRLGWSIFGAALREKYSENKMGFYDANLIESPYKNTDFSKHHHLSLPGILAFFFYPGSFLFLFFCMVLLGVLAASIEWGVYVWGGRNLILCALMSEVVAYRYASFGYVPAQSYLLFGTIALNILMIYILYKLIPCFGRRFVR